MSLFFIWFCNLSCWFLVETNSKLQLKKLVRSFADFDWWSSIHTFNLPEMFIIKKKIKRQTRSLLVNTGTYSRWLYWSRFLVILRRLQVQVQLQVQQGFEAQDVHKGVQHVLQEVRLRASWYFWERGRLPLLRQHDHPRRPTQMSLDRIIHLEVDSILDIICTVLCVSLYRCSRLSKCTACTHALHAFVQEEK